MHSFGELRMQKILALGSLRKCTFHKKRSSARMQGRLVINYSLGCVFFFSWWCTYTPNLPSINVVPVVEDFMMQPVPVESTEKGCDWVALYNSKVKKALDINLVHTFVHERWVVITKTPLLFLNFLEQRGLFCPFFRRWPISSNRVWSHGGDIRHYNWTESSVSFYRGSKAYVVDPFQWSAF